MSKIESVRMLAVSGRGMEDDRGWESGAGTFEAGLVLLNEV